MELISYVKDDEAALAKKLEKKLLNLSLSSGVLFVGVGVLPGSHGGPPTYEVVVGCSRKVDPRMIPTLVETTLFEEVKAGLQIHTTAWMGSIREM